MSLPPTFWRRPTGIPEHEPESQNEVTTDEGNTVEEGEVYNI